MEQIIEEAPVDAGLLDDLLALRSQVAIAD